MASSKPCLMTQDGICVSDVRFLELVQDAQDVEDQSSGDSSFFWWAFLTGWWFGPFFIFPYIWNDNANWLIFFRGFETTSQLRTTLQMMRKQNGCWDKALQASTTPLDGNHWFRNSFDKIRIKVWHGMIEHKWSFSRVQSFILPGAWWTSCRVWSWPWCFTRWIIRRIAWVGYIPSYFCGIFGTINN